LGWAHLPALVTTEFAGPFGDWWVIAMERLGPNLLEHDRERKLHPWRWWAAATYAQWIEQIADSLGEMHGTGNVHGDIKISNVMLDPPRSTAKLADFSRAREATEDDHATKNDQLQLARVSWMLLTGSRYSADPEHVCRLLYARPSRGRPRGAAASDSRTWPHSLERFALQATTD
jgi:hypothetical protein